MAKQNIIKSAFVLALCGIVCKVLGAVYRVPLTNILGSNGMGMYYLIFPIFSFMLSLSSASLPSALSRLVAECLGEGDKESAKKYFRCSVILFFCFGLLCSLFVIVLAPSICALQNNSQNILSYIIIAPSILIVCVISCYRGYFQGYQNMTYSGVSQIIEQVVKVVLGLILASKLVVYGLSYGVLGCIIAITIAEVFAFIYLMICKICFDIKGKRQNIIAKINKTKELPTKFYYKKIITTSIPFTLGYVIFPLATLIDSLIVVPLLTKAGIDNNIAVSVFGLNNAVVGTLTNLPIVVSTSLAMVILPSLTFSIKNEDLQSINKKLSFIYRTTIFCVLPCVIVFALFGKWVIVTIFGQLATNGFNELFVSNNMLIISSVGVLYLVIFQVTTAILQANGNFYKPVISLSVGVVIKVILSIVLLLIPNINFYAVNLANVVCYITICYINIHYLEKCYKSNVSFRQNYLAPICSCIIMCLTIFFGGLGFRTFLQENLAYLLALVLGACVYIGVSFCLKSFSREELNLLIRKK